MREKEHDREKCGFVYNEVWDYVTNVDSCEPLIPAYTASMKARHVELLNELPWVMPTPSGGDGLVLGQSRGWAGEEIHYAERTFAPQIPPQDIYSYAITDPHIDREKKTIVLASGNHPHEHMGCWVLEGMVNFLAGTDLRAGELRREAVFYVYPLLNPDGRIFHMDFAPRGSYDEFAGSPEMYAQGFANHNRLWNTDGKVSTIDILKSAMRKDTGADADYLWDFHGGCPHNPGDIRSAEPGMDSAYARVLEERGAPYPEVERKVKNPGGDSGSKNLRIWAMEEDGLNVTNSFTFEPGMQLDREEAMNAGRELALGFFDLLVMGVK